jgi:hypothetical protein
MDGLALRGRPVSPVDATLERLSPVNTKSGTLKATLAVALLVALGSPSVASAGLERVGPTMSGIGYPQWYQDSTGVVLEFCSPSPGELATGHCLLLPADTTAPESFPDQFADEHFYWAARTRGSSSGSRPRSRSAPSWTAIRSCSAASASGSTTFR